MRKPVLRPYVGAFYPRWEGGYFRTSGFRDAIWLRRLEARLESLEDLGYSLVEGKLMNEIRRMPIVGVAVDPRSYVNIFYILMSFPLGIFYFVFLVTGVSLGVGLAIVWVGIPILLLVLGGSWLLCKFERALAILVLGESIPPITRERRVGADDDGLRELSVVERLFIAGWRRFKDHLSDRLTWTGIIYLLLKFPLGTASFVVVVTLVSVTAALLGAPFYYWVDDGIDLGVWQVDELWEALILTLIGIPAALISMHVINAAAILSGKVARIMLGRLH